MTELDDLLKEVKKSTNYQTNKRILREKIQTELHFPHNNGLFKLTPELLAFVATWPTDELYVEDTYQNPILVDKQVFLITARQHYQKVMDIWSTQHNELKRIRKI